MCLCVCEIYVRADVVPKQFSRFLSLGFFDRLLIKKATEKVKVKLNKLLFTHESNEN